MITRVKPLNRHTAAILFAIFPWLQHDLYPCWFSPALFHYWNCWLNVFLWITHTQTTFFSSSLTSVRKSFAVFPWVLSSFWYRNSNLPPIFSTLWISVHRSLVIPSLVSTCPLCPTEQTILFLKICQNASSHTLRWDGQPSLLTGTTSFILGSSMLRFGYVSSESQHFSSGLFTHPTSPRLWIKFTPSM